MSVYALTSSLSAYQAALTSNGNDSTTFRVLNPANNTVRSLRAGTNMTLTQLSDSITITNNANLTNYSTWNDIQTLSAVYGGGTVTWTASTSSISWSSRIIALPAASGTNQYYEINMPALSTAITYYRSNGTTGTVTVSSSGIQLLNNEALVYFFAASTGFATSNSLFAVIDYRNVSWNSANMILIAQRCSDNSGHIRWLRSVNIPTSSDSSYNPDIGFLTTTLAASTYATISSLSSYLTAATAASTYAPLASQPYVGGRISSAGAAVTQIGRSSYTMEATGSHATGLFVMTFPSYGSTNYTIIANATTSSGNPNVCSWFSASSTGVTIKVTNLAGTPIDVSLNFLIF
jgi:hypothetical protein